MTDLAGDEPPGAGQMRLIDRHSAKNYLRGTRRIEPAERVLIRELSGGVSNMVLLVERPDRPGTDFVIKQARAQLRTREPWFSSVERIWREAEVLAICTRLLAQHAARAGSRPLAACTPTILFEDRDNYLLGMTAAPRPNTVWKANLLAGRADGAIAQQCGRLLAIFHGESWLDRALAAQLGDRTLFDQLRVDPYYRTLAHVRPLARSGVASLIESLEGHPRSLVHADFSPKNLLVFAGGLMMVDFETGHYGDPAFDLGFFLSHLVLKSAFHLGRHATYLTLADQFCQTYGEVMAARIRGDELSSLWARGMQNLAGCIWARLDGKSPVEYLTQEPRREALRSTCLAIFEDRPANWSNARAVIASALDALTGSANETEEPRRGDD